MISPDGSQIVFLKGAAESQEIWLMRADGEQSRKLAGELGDLFRSPVWSAMARKSRFCEACITPGEYGVESQIEILDVARGERKVVLSQAQLGPALVGPALAWTNNHLVARPERFQHMVGENRSAH